LTVPQITWQLLTTAPNAPSAHTLVSWLADYGVASKIVSDTSLLGEFQLCRVYIDVTQAHRAQWLLAQRNFSDEELTLLATGGAVPAESDQ
jgi:hypothetical protein